MTDDLDAEPSTQGTAPASAAATSLAAFLGGLAASETASPHLRDAARTIIAEVEGDDGTGPFLTVVLRTQGRRLEPLADALLCLDAQTDDDFELIITRHDVDSAGAAEVDALISRQAPDFRARIRVIDVVGGHRAHPINVGVEAARGRYISVYDDDDLLFANWVEVFHRAADSTRGRMVRGLTATQRVSPELWPGDEEGFRTLSWPTAEYARHFDQAAHLRVNHSPFMSWAFPRWLFTRAGLRFDDELLVCEDWDVIQRGSLLAGVTESDHLTAIYRLWVGGESSYTNHHSDQWRESEHRVVQRLDESPILMPPGTVHRVRALQDDVDRLNGELTAIYGRRAWRLLARLHWLNPAVTAAARMSRPVRRALRGR